MSHLATITTNQGYYIYQQTEKKNLSYPITPLSFSMTKHPSPAAEELSGVLVSVDQFLTSCYNSEKEDVPQLQIEFYV